MDIEYSSDSKQPSSQNFAFFNAQNLNQPSFASGGGFFGVQSHQHPQAFQSSQHGDSQRSQNSNSLREKYFLSDDEEDEYREDEVCQEEDIDMFADDDPALSQLVPESQSSFH